ncbi:MAG: type II toxin-antitoxin system death-on-curing family toxin [Eubacteriales bacterium]|nr:type II toxin-antitoxin system death-on-curing family toxin [Eubacteriales bacterium]
MIRLSKPQILLLHEQLIAETGGSSGLRDEGMLDSALNTPFQTFSGEDIYPSLQQKAARLCFGLVKNHPFVDGNKRIGAHVMLVFLALNGIELQHTQTELSDVILQLSAGTIQSSDLLDWILTHQI